MPRCKDLVSQVLCIYGRQVGREEGARGEQHEAGLLKEGGGKFLWIEKTSKRENK